MYGHCRPWNVSHNEPPQMPRVGGPNVSDLPKMPPSLASGYAPAGSCSIEMPGSHLAGTEAGALTSSGVGVAGAGRPAASTAGDGGGGGSLACAALTYPVASATAIPMSLVSLNRGLEGSRWMGISVSGGGGRPPGLAAKALGTYR